MTDKFTTYFSKATDHIEWVILLFFLFFWGEPDLLDVIIAYIEAVTP